MSPDALERPGEVALGGIEAAILVVSLFLILYFICSIPSFALILWIRWRSREQDR